MSTTPKLGLTKPDYRTSDWHTPINNNLDILDAKIGQDVSPTSNPEHKSLVLDADGSVTVAADGNADNLVIRGSNGENTGLSILTSDTKNSQIRFGTQSDPLTFIFYSSTTLTHFGTRSPNGEVEIGVGQYGNVAIKFKSTRVVNMVHTATSRNYTNQAAAETAGLVDGDIYHTDGVLKIVY